VLTTRIAFVAVIATAAIIAAGSAFAQQTAATTSASSASGGSGSIPIGPLVAYPGIDFALGHDDNLFLSSSAPTASLYTIVSPNVRVEAKPGPHKFDFTLRVSEGRYDSSSADNYTDYSLLGNADMVFTARSGLKLSAEYRHGHDGRGTNDAAPTSTPNQYDNYGVSGVYRYGAYGARGRIEVDAGILAHRYTNNPTSTAPLNYDTSRLGGAFFWRVMPRTELFTHVGLQRFDYLESGSGQSSNITNYSFGVKWDATAATSGSIGVGQQKTDFISGSNPSFSSSSWDAHVRWSPLSYSAVDFVTSKQVNQSTGVGDAIVSKLYGATWSHAWSSRMRTQVLASYRDDAFINSTPSRVDNTTSFGLRANYDYLRWLRFGAEYTYSIRDSTISTDGYKRNLLLFTVGATL